MSEEKQLCPFMRWASVPHCTLRGRECNGMSAAWIEEWWTLCMRYQTARADLAEATVAPMLAALECLVRHAEIGLGDRCPGCVEALDQARAAIAAARGED